MFVSLGFVSSSRVHVWWVSPILLLLATNVNFQSQKVKEFVETNLCLIWKRFCFLMLQPKSPIHGLFFSIKFHVGFHAAFVLLLIDKDCIRCQSFRMNSVHKYSCRELMKRVLAWKSFYTTSFHCFWMSKSTPPSILTSQIAHILRPSSLPFFLLSLRLLQIVLLHNDNLTVVCWNVQGRDNKRFNPNLQCIDLCKKALNLLHTFFLKIDFLMFRRDRDEYQNENFIAVRFIVLWFVYLNSKNTPGLPNDFPSKPIKS